MQNELKLAKFRSFRSSKQRKKRNKEKRKKKKLKLRIVLYVTKNSSEKQSNQFVIEN